uniref:Uncharacterized protein n=1 Tax=Lactuca sativa TaxID=4236 RepID=A0A9R1V7N4_LACSA|nr:hypothetical protein LSAT_V11C600341050 [Lactuca sativa]
MPPHLTPPPQLATSSDLFSDSSPSNSPISPELVPSATAQALFLSRCLSSDSSIAYRCRMIFIVIAAPLFLYKGTVLYHRRCYCLHLCYVMFLFFQFNRPLPIKLHGDVSD